VIRKIFKHHWAIIAIVIGEVILRIWRLEALTTFGGDQGYDIEKIWQILHGNFTLLGPQISRFGGTTLYVGPLYYYFMAPFLFLANFDPIGISLSAIFARIITTLFIYLATKKLFNSKAAIFAAIISAVSPYWVNSLGPPSQAYFVPATIAAAFFLLIKLHESNKTKIKSQIFIYFALGFLIGLNLNFHYLGAIFAVPLLVYIFLYQKSQIIKKNVFLGLGFFVAISPIVLFEVRHKFFLINQALKQISILSQTSSSPPNFFKENAISAFRIMEQDSLGFNFSGYAFLILAFLAIVIIINAIKKSLKPMIYFSIILILLNILAASLYFGKIQPHYLGAAYPLVFIMLGLAIYLTAKINRIVPYFLLIFISGLLIPRNTLFSSSAYTMPEDLTLKEIRQISKIIAFDSESGAFNIASTLDGDSRAGPYRYLVKIYGKIPQDVEHYDTPDSLYVITRDPAVSVPANPLFEIASFQPANISGVWEIKGNIRLVKLSKKERTAQLQNRFITIVNPIRNRDYWQGRSINNLKQQLDAIQTRNLPATWLLEYDTLEDPEILALLRKSNKNQKVGAFLEVSENWATAAGVSYKIADGDYYRPDKVFLSGYSIQDRRKLIKTYFKKYQEVFGTFPQVAGAWYIDARSQAFLAKLGVKGVLVVSDQYDTDAASIWGKYWSFPYYPSKYNSLEPAPNQTSKIPIVNIQWAQRDPVAGFGKTIKDSRYSLQANDYIRNGFDSSFFDKLLWHYLENPKSDFIQITIGLEAGQEAVIFAEEFQKQLEKIDSLRNLDKLQVVTMEEFADWYRRKYPGISPSHFVTKKDDFWYMSPKFRAAIFKKGNNYILGDLRYYTNYPIRDYLYSDTNHYLDRKIPAQIDGINPQNQIILGQAKNLSIFENFDRLTLKLDNREAQINARGVKVNGQYILMTGDQHLNTVQDKVVYLQLMQEILAILAKPLDYFKYSKMGHDLIFGFSISDTKLVGFKGFSPGIYNFQFQSFSKFLSPALIVRKLQPWIN